MLSIQDKITDLEISIDKLENNINFFYYHDKLNILISFNIIDKLNNSIDKLKKVIKII